jgi:uncharacterized membrane protein YkoI
MNAKRGLIVGTLLVMATGTMAASAAPGSSDQRAIDFSKAPVTMSQAIATAEQQTGGRATRAKLENEKGKMLYEVKVAGKDKATEVQIDAQDGKVLATNAAEQGQKHGAHKDGEKR